MAMGRRLCKRVDRSMSTLSIQSNDSNLNWLEKKQGGIKIPSILKNIEGDELIFVLCERRGDEQVLFTSDVGGWQFTWCDLRGV